MIFQLPVRRFAGRVTNDLARIAALVAMLIVVGSAVAEDSMNSEGGTSASASTGKDSADKPGPQSAANKSPSKADINQAIAGLGSTDYRTREEAVRRLKSLGASAIEPLTKAAQSSDLEVSYRAVRVLQSLLDSDEVESQQQAADALESLSGGENTAAADLADDALSLYHLTQQDRALESLRRLGATINDANFGSDVEIVLDSGWHGKTEDLALLKRISHLSHLRILYVKLDERALKILAELTQLANIDTFAGIDLFGTGVSEEAATTLAQALPGAKIDCRKGAMLGVRCSPSSPGCTIQEVEPASAAEAADFHAGDEILKIEGRPIQEFKELTTYIGAKNIGDSVSIELRRNGQILTKQVALGKWPSKWPY